MTDDPIDFSDLNPTADRKRFDLLVDRITAAAAPELARRRLHQSVWWQLSSWRKPLLAVGMAFILTLLVSGEFGATPDEAEVGTDDIAIALGVPSAMSEWTGAGSAQGTAQLLFPGDEE
jgi:hypothetical protein